VTARIVPLKARDAFIEARPELKAERVHNRIFATEEETSLAALN